MSSPAKTAAINPFQFSLGWLLAYLTVMAAVSAGLAYGRHEAFRIYGSKEGKSNWIVWRFDVAVQEGFEQGPVRRRIPKSTEPPALVLMRDHFLVCLVGSLVLTTVLFGTFMVFVRGALASRNVEADGRRGQKPS
jgi:hypothetical protein